MPNFRVPAGSQSGGNPKKKRRTSQNTATPVTNTGNDMGPPNMMGGPMEPNTMYAGMKSEKFIKKCQLSTLVLTYLLLVGNDWTAVQRRSH